MKFQPLLSAALLLSVVTLSPTIITQVAVAKPTTQKPYCTAASNQGGFWWTWTANSRDAACFTAFTKVLGFGQSVDQANWGSYKANGLNKGTLTCKQGKKQVIGTGTAVFENGNTMAKSLNWNGCTFEILN